PRREAPRPALDALVGGIGVLTSEVGADAEHRLDRDRLRHHEAGVAPRLAPCLLRRLEKIAHDLVEALRLARHVRAAALRDLLPVGRRPAMDLVEELRLEDPLLLPRASAEAVDLVAERRVALAVEPVDDARRELLVRRRPGHAL